MMFVSVSICLILAWANYKLVKSQMKFDKEMVEIRAKQDTY